MLPGIKLFDLTGKAAVVTGGSKGLGAAMAAGLASAGADLLLASRHEEEAVAAAKEIARDYGHKALGLSADVTNPDDVAAMTQKSAFRIRQDRHSYQQRRDQHSRGD